MKSYEERKAETKQLEKWLVEAQMRELAKALNKGKELREEFDFTAGMLEGALAERRKEK
jgi:hypothetical protein